MTARELIADALGLPVEDIDRSTTLEATPEWDSLAHMRLALAIEAQIGRELSAEEILSIESLSDVEAMI